MASSAIVQNEQELSVERPLGPPAIAKLAGWDLFRSMGSPKFVVAPMVDQSELAWRILSRLHGSNLCYTPMIHSALFSNPANSRYRKEQFDIETGEEGHSTLDRPVIAQFCSNDKNTFLNAATILAESGKVDAVDLNLGCPQGIAKRGQYGAFLMEDWDLIESMISHLHKNLAVPITAKFRVYDSLEKTLGYAKMLERAGAQILTVHGRTREQKGQLTGLADWDKIRKIKETVSVPVFANGNILTYEDAQRCLSETGVDGIMSAEGNLYNPAIFEPLNRGQRGQASSYRSSLPSPLLSKLDQIDSRFSTPSTTTTTAVAHHPISQMSLQYLAIVQSLQTQTSLSAIKAHLFRMWKPIFSSPHGKYHDFREALSRISNMTKNEEDYKRTVQAYVDLTETLYNRLEDDYAAKSLENDPKIGLPACADGNKIPYSHCQPCLRPLSESAAATVTGTSKRALDELQQEEETALDATSAATKKLKIEAGIQDDCAIQILAPTLPCPKCNKNNASSRCTHKLCRACCNALTTEQKEGGNEDGGEVEECEAHLGKAKKEMEKKAFRQKAKEVKKAKKNEKKGAQNGNLKEQDKS